MLIFLLTYAHRSRWSKGHLRPLAIALCSGLFWAFQTSWSLTALHHKSQRWRPFLAQVNVLLCCRGCFCNLSFFTDRVISPTQTPLFSGRVGPALVTSFDMHGRAVGLFYAQPTGQKSVNTEPKTPGSWGRYHGGRRPSSDDSFHSPTVIPPSALHKPSIVKGYHRRRMTR